jgi:5-methylcytosine-specific restriction endonuclease McrA
LAGGLGLGSIGKGQVQQVGKRNFVLLGAVMKQLISEMREKLDQLEQEADAASNFGSANAITGLEFPEIMQDFVDFLLPNLTPYEAAIYVYLLRHSILSNGTQLTRVSVRGMRAVFKSASGISSEASYSTIQRTLNTLETVGAIRKQSDPNRDGTPYKINLPEEIDICQKARQQKISASSPVKVEDHELDYYNVRENRVKVFERDTYKCQHCQKQLTRFTVTLDHVVAVSRGGDNSLSNLITSCRECNSRKNARPIGDFMADSNPT